MKPYRISYARYVRELQAIFRSLDDLEDRTADEVIRLVGDTRRRLMDRLAGDTTDWEQFHYQKVERELTHALKVFGERYNRLLNDATTKAFDAGTTAIPYALVRAGNVSVDAIPDPLLFRNQLEFAYQYNASMVSRVTRRAHDLITKEVRENIAGIRRANESMSRIRWILDTDDRQHLGPVASQAETVIRTELGRVFSIANEASTQRSADILGREGLERMWVHSGIGANARQHHAGLHGMRIPFDERFPVGGYEASYPHDPNLPIGERARCRCRAVLWREEWTGARVRPRRIDADLQDLISGLPPEGERQASVFERLQYVQERLPDAMAREAFVPQLLGMEPVGKDVALAAAEYNLRGLPYERGYIVTDGGAIWGHVDGEADVIHFSQVDRKALRGSTLTHNHPAGHSFSPEDIMFGAQENLSEIRAVTRQWTHSLTYGSQVEDLESLALAIFETHEEVTRDFFAAIRDGTLDIRTADFTHWHEVWTRLTRPGGQMHGILRYRRRGVLTVEQILDSSRLLDETFRTPVYTWDFEEHGSHNQKDHGNWARRALPGVMTPAMGKNMKGRVATKVAKLMGLPADTSPEAIQKILGDNVIADIDGLKAQLKEAGLTDAEAGKVFDWAANWYEREYHGTAKAMAEKYGLPLEAAVGAISALSPRNVWEKNLEDAENVLKYVSQNKPYRIGAETAAYLRDRQGIDLKTWQGGKFLGRDVTPRELLAHGEEGAIVAGVSGHIRNGGILTNRTYMASVGHLSKGLMVAAGVKDPHDAFESWKQGNFFNNGMNPREGQWVTVDTHALQQMTRQTKKGFEFIGDSDYPFYASSFQKAARRYNQTHGTRYRAHQIQSLSWISWRLQRETQTTRRELQRVVEG